MGKILVVDDEMVSSFTLMTILSDDGHQVETASSGFEAIERGCKLDPDILICDWFLGDTLTGLEVAKNLAKKNKRIK